MKAKARETDAEAAMDGKTQGELILFPKTIEYYQEELTKMLEREAFGEAVRLLRFLTGCKTDDGKSLKEWNLLLEWLGAEFPDAEAEKPSEVEDEPGDERELLARSVAGKAARDERYAGKLIAMVSDGVPIDKQLAALEQLSHLPDDAAANALLRRLKEAALHPFVSFKLLQTLARLGVRGEATFPRLGEIVTVEIERTPAAGDRFPDPLFSIGERAGAAAESDDPNLALFVKQTWEEFLMYIYGTSAYRALLAVADDAELDAWACALHAAVAKAMYGEDRGTDLSERYTITGTIRPAYEEAYGKIAEFFRGTSGVLI